MIIRCANCGKANRIPEPPREAGTYTCGACHAAIYDSAAEWAKSQQARVTNTSSSGVNYYEVLQVNPAADVAVIKSAYRAIMRDLQTHPDLGGDEERAKVVNEAYHVLSDPDRRSEYDAFRRTTTEKVVDPSAPARDTVNIDDAMYVAAAITAAQQAIIRSGSWGYAGLPFPYLIAHRAWWHLLANLIASVIPVVNLLVYLWYVFNVKRLVISTRKFESFDQYLAVQLAWDKAGKWALAVVILIVIVRVLSG